MYKHASQAPMDYGVTAKDNRHMTYAQYYERKRQQAIARRKATKVGPKRTVAKAKETVARDTTAPLTHRPFEALARR